MLRLDVADAEYFAAFNMPILKRMRALRELELLVWDGNVHARDNGGVFMEALALVGDF
jgi:hypothetical protein